MKNKIRSAPRALEPDPKAVDSVVEDLSQQDVLPSNTAGTFPKPPQSDDLALDEAGRWDEPVGDRGHRAERVPLEDEKKAAEQLVEEGMSEAEEELRDLDEEREDEEEQVEQEEEEAEEEP